MATIWSRLMAGITAFREAYLKAGLEDYTEYQSYDARRLRYTLYWAMYENTAYRNVHTWATAFRQNQQLYRYIRGIYNPAYRLGEFWKAHLWGGRLDPEAGDGTETPTAIPIITDNDNLRPYIGKIWRWSNWGINKQITSLYGSILGDVLLQVVDDTQKNKVYILPLHPGILADADIDAWGNIKSYKFQEERTHPDIEKRVVTYTETAERDGQNVIYKTYLNNQPYAWNNEAEWEEPYGFIPLVLIQHNNVGLDYGMSELHPGRGKFAEADDLASKLSDQIRKMVDAPWLLSGVDKPRTSPRAEGRSPTITAPNPGKEEVPVLYGPVGATASPLVAPLDISATAAYITSILAEIERDYPELQMDIWSAGGQVTGRALRVARQRVTTKVKERRAVYDDNLARAIQMALSIGGLRGIFEGVGLESYDSGGLDMSIGEREVFAVDPLDDIEEEGAFWGAANQAIKAGVPLEVYLKRKGWTEEDIAEITSSPEHKARLAALKSAAMMAEGASGDLEGEPDTDNPDNLSEGIDFGQ